jgi:hypothetical protein
MLTWLLRRPSGLLLVVLLIAFALLASMAAGPPRRPEPYEPPPPPCRLVPGPAGAWSDAQCLRAPARHHARSADRRGRPGAGS